MVQTLSPKAVDLISGNFKGSPTDMDCYKHFMFIKGYESKGQCDKSSCPIYGFYNRNQYDQLFSGWADYWSWRVDQDGPGSGLQYRVDPNLLKAFSYNETGVGKDQERANQLVISVSQEEIHRVYGDFLNKPGGYSHTMMLNLTKYGMAWYAGDIKEVTDCLDGDTHTLCNRFNENHVKPWGFIHVPDWNINANQEIAVATRVAYGYFYQAKIFESLAPAAERGTYQYYALKYINGMWEHGSGDPMNVWDLYNTGYWNGELIALTSPRR